MYDIDVIIPTIRIHNWPKIIKSVQDACSYKWRIIFVGPIPEDVNNFYTCDKVLCIQDLGSPNRCQQIGIILADSKFVTWHSDDCFYENLAIDKCLPFLDDYHFVVSNYIEGGNVAVNNFSLNHCYPRCENIKDEWVIMNVAFTHLSIMSESLGGFDCRFETTCFGHADLAVRAQFKGLSVYMNDIIVSNCLHMPARTGDHFPVDWAFQEDAYKYKIKYNSDFSPYINPANFLYSPAVWTKRFSNEVRS